MVVVHYSGTGACGSSGGATLDIGRVTCTRCRTNLRRAGIKLARGPIRRDGADAEAERILDELKARLGTGNRVLAQQFLAAELRKIAQGPRKWGLLR